jgi:hypothetical protein
VAALLAAGGLAWAGRRRRALAAYRCALGDAKRWRRLGLSPQQADRHGGLGPAFVEGWLGSGFTLEEMDELLRHKIFLAEAVAWRRAGVATDVASEWGRYRLTPRDLEAWSAQGFRANAAYTCKSLGLTPAEAVVAYERGEHPAQAAARRDGRSLVTVHAPAGWSGFYPSRDAAPVELLSWDDDEDGPKHEWWAPAPQLPEGRQSDRFGIGGSVRSAARWARRARRRH